MRHNTNIALSMMFSLMASMTPAKGVEAELKPIPFKDFTPDGVLKARAELSFRRLQEPYFQWDNVSRVNFEAFPGDAIGRTINGLTLLSQALNQPEPASLKEIMRRVPSLANPAAISGRSCRSRVPTRIPWPGITGIPTV